MELEIRTNKTRFSFLYKSLDHLMSSSRPREFLDKLTEWDNRVINCLPESSTAVLESLENISETPFEPTGNATAIIDLRLKVLIVRPDNMSYVYYPLHRYVPDWKEYLV